MPGDDLFNSTMFSAGIPQQIIDMEEPVPTAEIEATAAELELAVVRMGKTMQTATIHEAVGVLTPYMDDAAFLELLHAFVITSYSIHYTKLYEEMRSFSAY